MVFALVAIGASTVLDNDVHRLTFAGPRGKSQVFHWEEP
jgi:hypothetical protein